MKNRGSSILLLRIRKKIEVDFIRTMQVLTGR
jgi:hypothetical protein